MQKPLRHLTLADLQAFADSLAPLAETSRARRIKAVKSLFGFAFNCGYVPMNAAAALRLPPIRDTLAERILTEEQVQRMLALENNPRNYLLIRLLYTSGVRVSELVRLRWCNVQERGERGQITVFGKGGKTRSVLISAATWREVQQLRIAAPTDPLAPVFTSMRGGHAKPRAHLSASQAARVAGRNERRVREWIRTGQLPARTEGGEWSIALADLLRVPGVTLRAKGLGTARTDVPHAALHVLSPSPALPDALSVILERLESIGRLLASLVSHQQAQQTRQPVAPPAPELQVAEPAVVGRLDHVPVVRPNGPIVRPRRRPDGTPKVVWRVGIYEPTRVLAAQADPPGTARLRSPSATDCARRGCRRCTSRASFPACGSSRG